jgi:hypothetical protein
MQNIAPKGVKKYMEIATDNCNAKYFTLLSEKQISILKE